MAGLQVGRALGCSGSQFGLGVSSLVPHVLGHPTSICAKGVKILSSLVY